MSSLIHRLQHTAPVESPSAVSLAAVKSPRFSAAPSFDTFYKTQSGIGVKPLTLWEKVQLFFKRKQKLAWQQTLTQQNTQNTENTRSGETVPDQLAMVFRLQKALLPASKGDFNKLLNDGVLTQTSTDFGHSTLFYLYSLLTNPRATGIPAKTILNETIQTLSKPYRISQTFPGISDTAALSLIQTRQSPYLRNAQNMPVRNSLSKPDVAVKHSATCVASSVMYRMAEKYPADFVRHIQELTGPGMALFEKARLDEISPEDPTKAIGLLKGFNTDYQQISEDEVLVKVSLPQTVRIRMINDANQFQSVVDGKQRTAIGTAYQTAMMQLATGNAYDVTVDELLDPQSAIFVIDAAASLTNEQKDELFPLFNDYWAPPVVRRAVLEKLNTYTNVSPEERAQIEAALNSVSYGLTEPQKTFMERVMVDDGSISSVRYQVVSGKSEPAEGEDPGQPYLYGYTRTFEQITNDILSALKQGEFAIVGFTFVQSDGSIPPQGGHEVTITGAFIDPQDRELKFVVVDSDDQQPTPVVRTARELVPKIHHVGLPADIAAKANAEIEGLGMSYYIPDDTDAKNFDLVPVLQEPLPVYSNEAAVEAQPATEAVTTPVQSPTPVTTPQAIPQPIINTPGAATPPIKIVKPVPPKITLPQAKPSAFVLPPLPTTYMPVWVPGTAAT